MPECFGFQGMCDDVSSPRYKILNPTADAKIKNSDMRKRIKAANKIIELDLESAQAMLLRLNGSFFQTPTELDDCQNLLMDFVDDAEEPGLNAVLKEETSLNIDEQTTILIGSLINAGQLSFDKVQGKISKKLKDGKWAEVRDMANEYSMDEKKRLFSDFLNTDAGKALREDLENDFKAFDAKASTAKKTLKTV